MLSVVKRSFRDYEFSFAKEKWSIMVCDEAQKIKNPNSIVTRVAKAQNVRFRIACTGTPVENSLTDLWCLFDFVQPGLLPALNIFGKTYQKQSRAEVVEKYARYQRAFPDIHDEVVAMYPSENKVIVEFISTGTMASGAAFKLPIITVLRTVHSLYSKWFCFRKLNRSPLPMLTFPLLGSISPLKIFKKVLFPAPLAPIIP